MKTSKPTRRFSALLAAVLLTVVSVTAQFPAGPPAVPGMPSTPLAPGFGPKPFATSAWAISDHDFALLLNAISNQTFSSNQLPMVQAAGLCGYFTCGQCAQLMALFDFDSNKLQVVTYLAPHLIDPIRCQPIMDQLTFNSDQKKAWEIISAANP